MAWRRLLVAMLVAAVLSGCGGDGRSGSAAPSADERPVGGVAAAPAGDVVGDHDAAADAAGEDEADQDDASEDDASEDDESTGQGGPRLPSIGAPTKKPATAPADEPDVESPDEPAPAGVGAFVRVVRRELPYVAHGRTRQEIASVALTACGLLASGEAADTVVAGTRSLGTADAEAVDEATARELVKLAIDLVCVDHAHRVDEF